MTPAERRLWSVGIPSALGAALLLATLDAGVAVALALAAGTLFAARLRMWALAACAAVWTAALLAVRVLPGPYDSWAGRGVLPVLAGYVTVFLLAWAVGRRLIDRRDEDGDRTRPALSWPSERRLLTYLSVLLGIAVVTAAIRFRGTVPPLLADNPDAARQCCANSRTWSSGCCPRRGRSAWPSRCCVRCPRAAGRRPSTTRSPLSSPSARRSARARTRCWWASRPR
ncbi:hypothetical protein V2I01_21370 [Micromonospora sp. BRA006-A]|nr:hypothetical protein [Micromonospora sp. BRA006-A]